MTFYIDWFMMSGGFRLPSDHRSKWKWVVYDITQKGPTHTFKKKTY